MDPPPKAARAQNGADHNHRIDEHHRAAGCGAEVQREQALQSRCAEVDSHSTDGSGIGTVLGRDRSEGREGGGRDEQRREDETYRGTSEQPVEANDRQQCGSKRRAQQAFKVICQSGK